MPVAALVGAGLMVVWVCGIVIGIGRLLYALRKHRRVLVGAPWQADFWTLELQTQLARKLGLGRFPAVHLSPVAPMPMVIGLWRPRIVLPEAAPPSWTQEHWEAVLLHEAAHIARGDHWAALAQRGAVILFWWCPLVHVLARRLNELREQICDDWALEGSCDHIAYAELLVESAERFLNLKAQPVPLGLLASARGGLEARVKRLLAMEKPNMTKLTLPGKLLGAALLGAACLLTTTGTAFSGGTGGTPPKKVQIKIIVDGKELDLSDARLWELLEAPKKQAAAEDQLKEALRALAAAEEALHKKAAPQAAGAKPDKAIEVTEAKGVTFSPDGKVTRVLKDVKGVAFSPDGKILSVGDGKGVIVIDTASGKIIAKFAHGAIDGHKVVTGKPVAQGKVDERIEELVRQAEAIKPGSGVEVRKALQGVPKAGEAPKDPKAKSAPPGMGLHVLDPVTGQKIIVLEIEDGNLLKLGQADLQKLLDALKLHGDRYPANEKAKPADWSTALEWLRKQQGIDKVIEAKVKEVHGKEKSATDKNLPPSSAPDLEALSRHVQRLQAEVEELRKRLESGKK
jgi:beta-lactamase regulating signal transducer with metallopeptidase domain